MNGSQALIARAALGLAAAALAIVLAWLQLAGRFQSLSSRQFDRALTFAFALSRLTLFALAYGVLHLAPRGDIPLVYYPQALAALAHKLPYRDFPSSYAPLHPYLDAALLRLWPSPLALLLFPVLAEILLVPLSLRLARTLLPRNQIPEPQVRLAALLYLASPISLQFVTIDGQDNVVIALLLTLALLLLHRRRDLLAGAALALALVTIKFLPLLYAPLLLLAAPRRPRLLAGSALVLAPVYATFLFLHAPVLQPLAAEGGRRSASDLPYLLETLLNLNFPDRLLDATLALILLALLALAFRSPRTTRLRTAVFASPALTLALLLFAKKSWPPYLVLTLFPLCLLLSAGPRNRPPLHLVRIVLFALFSVVAVTEHSFWATRLAQFSSSAFHAALLLRQPAALLFLALEIALLTGYAWLLVESARSLRPTAQESEPGAQFD